MPSVTRLAP
ncbi:hypothetical protein YPPY61_1848, partial [Yersinia pestis PY-61]